MSLEEECMAVLAKEVGPAAKPFLTRQCRTHLKKEPRNLQKSDVAELANWCFIGLKQSLGMQVAENVKKGLLDLK